MIKVINIKDNNPTVDYALCMLETELKNAQIEGVQVLVVIHGYGSHGTGGQIKRSTRQLLRKLKRQNKIATYVGGEEWSNRNDDVALITKICPSVILSKDIGNLNPGVTVVLLNK